MTDRSDIEFEGLIKQIKDYNLNANIELISKAYYLAKKAHQGQKRDSGEPYIEHPLGVVKILIRMKADSNTLAAALLHDVVEDTSVTDAKIRAEFGDEVANLVNGVTKIDKIHFNDVEEYKAENLRKILLASSKDIRVMLIKLADRFHNMQTLKYVNEEKQKRIAKDTLEIYAPIAQKLGMYQIKGELEDLSLRFLEPKIYSYLKSRLSEKRGERELKTQKIIAEIRATLEKNNVKSIVTGRAKYFYSIYKKMKKENKKFEDIYDLIGIRIITASKEQCYHVLRVIHDNYQEIKGRFKDYITLPKPNNYQSIHTSVLGPYDKVLEIQIRSKQMDDVAEDGVAAHWKYKETERDKKFERKLSWLKQLLQYRRESNVIKDLENFSINVFENEIVVFTPKGQPIVLPEGSCPVDFAYELHTDLGNSCSKSKVNDKIVPLDHQLESGDVVEIITQKNALPSRQWLRFVKTSVAKNKIRTILGIEKEHRPKVSRRKMERDKELTQNPLKFIRIHGKASNIKLSKCCNPKYGESIVAFYTKDGSITIHKTDCINIHSLQNEKKADVRWVEHKHDFIQIRIYLKDRPGIVRDVLEYISKKGISMLSVYTSTTKHGLKLTLRVEPKFTAALTEALIIIKSDPYVRDFKIN